MKPASAVIVGALMIAGFSELATAHHSFAMFDRSKKVALDGTIKSIQLINPHSWFVITAPGADKVPRDYTIEGPSPNILLRQGWKHNDVNAGDRVTMTFNPLKDGSPGGVLVSIKLAGGRELSGVPAGLPGVPDAPPAGLPPPGGPPPGVGPPPGIGPPPGVGPPGGPGGP